MTQPTLPLTSPSKRTMCEKPRAVKTFSCSGCGIVFDRVPSRNARPHPRGDWCSRKCWFASIDRSKPEAFWSHTDRLNSGCWEWLGVITVHGYGHVRVLGKLVRVHRYALVLTHGAIPAGLVVCHRCDNRRCVNPDHLFVATQRENNDDKIRKGRDVRGDRHPNTKVSDAQVAEIRATYRYGNGKQLAAKYGVALTTLIQIASGKQRKPRYMPADVAHVA